MNNKEAPVESKKTDWLRSLGWSIIWLFVIEMLLGVLLLFSYKNSASMAYFSVAQMRESELWRFIQGLHHWMSALLIISTAVYIFMLLWTGGYARSRKFMWPVWLLFFVLLMLFQLTGHILPWDTQAVRTAVVETAIASSVPIVGKTYTKIISGGSEVGTQTLDYWAFAHFWIFGAVGILFLIMSIRNFRQNSAKPEKISFLFLMFVCSLAAMTTKTPLYDSAAADDFINGTAKPEWYILPMHALLKFAQKLGPKWGFLGSAVAPTLLFVVLLILGHTRQASEKVVWRVRLACLLIVSFTIFLMLPLLIPKRTGTYYAALSGDQKEVKMIIKSDAGEPDPVLVAKGKQLYKDFNCASCHKIAGVGDTEGPKLDGVGTRKPSIAWHIDHLNNPEKMHPGSTMPSIADINDSERSGKKLDPAEVTALSNYLRSLK